MPTFFLDDRVFHLLYGRDNPALTDAAIAFSALGSGWTLLAIAPLGAAKRTRRFATWLVGALVGTAGVVAGLKLAIGRGRPFTVYPPLERALVDSPTDYSFPSGHAAGSFCFAMFVTHVLLSRRPRPRFARRTSTVCLLFASCVAVSRVVLGFHFPADVLAGSVLGGTIGVATARRFATGA